MRGNPQHPFVVVIGMYTTQNYPVDTRIALLVRLDLIRFLQRITRR